MAGWTHGMNINYLKVTMLYDWHAYRADESGRDGEESCTDCHVLSMGPWIIGPEIFGILASPGPRVLHTVYIF